MRIDKYAFTKAANTFLYHKLYVYFFLSFYVLHEWNRFLQFVSLSTVLLVWIGSLLFCFLAVSLFSLVFGSRKKAVLFVLLLSAGFLYFINIRQVFDWLMSRRLTFACHFLLFTVFYIIILLVIKSLRETSKKNELFLSFIFLAFIVWEIFFLISSIVKPPEPLYSNPFGLKKKINFNSNTRQSVYLILLDEYAGVESLERGYSFTNAHFLNHLRDLDFQVIKNATSNYKNTVLSMPSILNGEYLFNKEQSDDEVFVKGLWAMYSNSTFNLFRKSGYQTYNFSPFLIENQPPFYRSRFLPSGCKLLLSSSVFLDLYESAPTFFLRSTGNNEKLKEFYLDQVKPNFDMLDSVLLISKNVKNQPVFAYLHLTMPHAPYVLDSVGKFNSSFILSGRKENSEKKKAYLEYLAYTNKIIYKFLSDLKKNTNGDAIILLMSDHGCKDFDISEQSSDKFNCLNAVYYPGKDKSDWYDGMSNVNQFRILISKITNEKIPLFKDSTIR